MKEKEYEILLDEYDEKPTTIYKKDDIETLRKKLIDEFTELIIDCSILFFNTKDKDKIEGFAEWIKDKDELEFIPFLYRGIMVHTYHDFIKRINKLFGIDEA